MKNYFLYGRFILILFLLFSIVGCFKPSEKNKSEVKDTKVETHTFEEKKEIDLSPAYGDTIIEWSSADAVILNPLIYCDSPSGDIIALIFNGLVKYDENLRLVGDLADTWEVLDEGKTIIFKLKKGVKWHDGEKFTAEDVKFTVDKLLDPKTLVYNRSDYELIDTVEIIDDYTIKVRYKKVFAPALESFGIGIIPKHIYEHEDINNSRFNRHPIGTGPFKFVSWTPDEQIVLEAFDDYFDGRPYIDRYIYKVIPEDSMAFLALKRGELDIKSLNPDQYKKQANTEEFLNRFNVYRYAPGSSYTYIGYNLTKDKFKDKRVRQALTMAIDRQVIIDNILYGYGKIITGPYSSSSWAYDKSVKPFPYAPDKAKELLSEAGWNDTDGDGFLDKDGKMFEIVLSTGNGNKTRKLAAKLIKQYWETIGIKVKLNFVEWSYLMKMCDYMDFDAIILGWGLGRDPDQAGIWHSSEIPDMKRGKGGNNYMGYINKEVDRLLEEGRTTFEFNKRREIYQKFFRIIHEDQPYTFLYERESIVAVNNRIHGIKIAPAGIFYNFEKWYVPKVLQRY